MRAGNSRGNRFGVLAGATVLICAGPAMADVKTGVDAWSAGNFSAAVREWQEPARNGDPDAQFNMAQAYKLGRGVPADLGKAEELFTKASMQGHQEAGDNLGLILFQRGERQRAMPYIQSASSRGDPRAHYILGLVYFNGDGMAKDWERAYALMSLAQQANLPQAANALAQMDKHIPLEQRQRGVALASTISAETDANRLRHIAAADLAAPGGKSTRAGKVSDRPLKPETSSDSRAGADFVPKLAPPKKPAPALAPAGVTKPALAPTPSTKAPSAAAGPWKLQLGAFSVKSNADSLWNRVKSRPEVTGRTRLMVPAGRVTRLLVAGYADPASAQTACRSLTRAGFECMVSRD